MDLENNNFAVQMKNITKKFGDFTANDNIDLDIKKGEIHACLLYTSPSPRDRTRPRMPSSA